MKSRGLQTLVGLMVLALLLVAVAVWNQTHQPKNPEPVPEGGLTVKYPPFVGHGGFVRVIWSISYADSCRASWEGQVPLEGNEKLGPLYRSGSLALSCKGQGGTITSRANVCVMGDKGLLDCKPTDTRHVLTYIETHPA